MFSSSFYYYFYHLGGDLSTEKVCRICQQTDTETPRLQMIRPCLCRGSLSFVHINCLNRWRETSHSAHLQCQICHYQYQIQRTTLANYLFHPNFPVIITCGVMLLAISFVGWFTLYIWKIMDSYRVESSNTSTSLLYLTKTLLPLFHSYFLNHESLIHKNCLWTLTTKHYYLILQEHQQQQSSRHRNEEDLWESMSSTPSPVDSFMIQYFPSYLSIPLETIFCSETYFLICQILLTGMTVIGNLYFLYYLSSLFHQSFLTYQERRRIHHTPPPTPTPPPRPTPQHNPVEEEQEEERNNQHPPHPPLPFLNLFSSFTHYLQHTFGLSLSSPLISIFIWIIGTKAQSENVQRMCFVVGWGLSLHSLFMICFVYSKRVAHWFGERILEPFS